MKPLIISMFLISFLSSCQNSFHPSEQTNYQNYYNSTPLRARDTNYYHSDRP